MLYNNNLIMLIIKLFAENMVNLNYSKKFSVIGIEKINDY